MIIDPSDGRALPDALREHAHVVLGAGVHEVDGFVRLPAGRIVGLGPRVTTLRVHGGAGLLVDGGELEIRGVRIEAVGLALGIRAGAVRLEQVEVDAGAALEVEGDGRATLADCSLVAGSGAVLRVSGTAVVTLTDCRLIAGQTAGGVATERATLALRRCLVAGAAGDGVVARGRAWVELDGTRVTTCGGCGARGRERAHLLVRGGELADNADAGLYVTEGAGGAVEDARVRANGGDGLRAAGRSVLAASRNEVLDNRGAGVAVLDRADAELHDNRVHANARFGVWVADDARAELRRNDLANNGAVGIALTERSAARALGNRATGNGWFAIHADPDVRVSLADNELVERPEADDELVASRDEQEVAPLADLVLPSPLELRAGVVVLGDEALWRLSRLGPTGDVGVAFAGFASRTPDAPRDGVVVGLPVQRVDSAVRFRSPLVRRHLDRHRLAPARFADRPVAALDWPGAAHYAGPHRVSEAGATYCLLLPVVDASADARAAFRARLRAGERPRVPVAVVLDGRDLGGWREDLVLGFVLADRDALDAYADLGEPARLVVSGAPHAVSAVWSLT